MCAKIQVHDKSAWECSQSRHGHLPKLPARGILVAPSQQFETTALTDMILRHYTDGRGKSCFERIFVFSPSVDIDSSWGPVKEFVRVNIWLSLIPRSASSTSSTTTLLIRLWKTNTR